MNAAVGKQEERVDLNKIGGIEMKNNNIKKTILHGPLVGLALIICSLPAFAGARKHSADLDSVAGPNVRVIISYSEKLESAHLRRIVFEGGSVEARLDHVRTIVATIPTAALPKLESAPGVSYISPDRPVHASLDFTTAAVNANVAYQSGYTGAGVGIAIVDSGINSRIPT